MKTVLPDRLQPQSDHQQHAVRGTAGARKMSCVVTTSDVVQQANACRTISLDSIGYLTQPAKTALMHGPQASLVQGLTLVDLENRCQSTGAGVVPNKFIWPSDSDGTIGWLICYHFSTTFLAAIMHTPDDPSATYRAYVCKTFFMMWLIGHTKRSTQLRGSIHTAYRRAVAHVSKTTHM